MEKSEFLSSVVTPTNSWVLFKLLVQILEDYKEGIKPQMEAEQTRLPNDRGLKAPLICTEPSKLVHQKKTLTKSNVSPHTKTTLKSTVYEDTSNSR